MFDVLATADQFLLPRLKSIAEKEICCRCLDLQNVCSLFELANTYCAAELIQVCPLITCVSVLVEY